jgi:ATP-dependent DNA helicase PIF1
MPIIDLVFSPGETPLIPFPLLHRESTIAPGEGPFLDPEEDAIWRALNAKQSILISGPGGSGKSYIVKRFIDRARQNPSIRMVVTAPTAVAATNVGGVTLHKALGLGLANEDPSQIVSKLMAKRVSAKYQVARKFILETQILVIDEISMLSPYLFRLVEFLARKLRLTKKHEEQGVFGGMQ